MRLQCRKPINVKNKAIGGKLPLICLPMIATDKDDLLAQADELKALNPDLLEWRIDGFSRLDSVEDCLKALTALSDLIDPIPLIFTLRIESEGGMQPISQNARLDLILESIKTGLLDIVDIELCNDKPFIDTVLKAAVENNTRMILSYHDFEKTPSAEFILNTLQDAREKGADIAKLAAMPKSHDDVLTLLGATLAARKTMDDLPLVTMSMGEDGVISRVAGGIYGSDITFASGKSASAPGQIPINDLRQAMSVFYP